MSAPGNGGGTGVMKEKRFAGRGFGQNWRSAGGRGRSSQTIRTNKGGAQSKMRRVATARWAEERKRRAEVGWNGGAVSFSQVLESEAEPWTARRVAEPRRRWQ